MLSQLLGTEQPVHGMRSGFLVIKHTEANIATLSSHYADEMIDIQPTGTFIVGGNCRGSIIARGIAQELHERGRLVELLILMEPREFLPHYGPVALIFGRKSHYNPYLTVTDPDQLFKINFPAGYTINLIDCAHGFFFTDKYIKVTVDVVQRLLSMPSSKTPSISSEIRQHGETNPKPGETR